MSKNRTTTAIADSAVVRDTASHVETVVPQEILHEISEAVRGAFPRPSDVCEVVLIDVDSRHVHAFWNVPPATVANLRTALGLSDDTTPLVLRMIEILPRGETGAAFDIEVLGLQGQYYVDIWGEARRYRGAIGLRLRDGEFAPLAQSNIVDLPPAGPSQDNTWREIALPAPLATTIARLPLAAPVPSTAANAIPASAPAASPPAANATAARSVAAAAAPSVAAVLLPEVGAVVTAAVPAAAAAVTQPAPAPVNAEAATVPPASGPSVGGPSVGAPLVSQPPAVAGAATGQPALADPPAATLVSAAAVPIWADPFSPAPEVAFDALAPVAGDASPTPMPAPAGEPDALATAINTHERDATAPLAPRAPYYDPDHPPEPDRQAERNRQPETEGGERTAAPPAATGAEVSDAAVAANAEGPEPVPLPLENVLTLSSFAVAGGPVEFEINAELHIFGRAKAGLQLQLFGRPVAIRPDGSFSINRPLPNGALVLSVLLAKNGEREE